MQKAFIHWAPAVLCLFLCAWSLLRSFSSATDSWQPVFFAFLPMCFVFVGLVTTSLLQRIDQLQSEIARLRDR
jgi:hypothetical protein